MTGWRSPLLLVAAFLAAVFSAVVPPGPTEDALRISWAILLVGAMICGAIEERGER